jgi:hypothetical protein
MPPIASVVPATSTEVWKLIERDYTLRLSLVANEWATEHLREWNAVFAEDRRRGNAGYCGPALVEMEIADADKRAEWSYQTCCENMGDSGPHEIQALLPGCFRLLPSTDVFDSRRLLQAGIGASPETNWEKDCSTSLPRMRAHETGDGYTPGEMEHKT